jgi:tRNA nucleotidyltransferase/poly(A) polymerase
MEIFKFKDFIKENIINKKLPVPNEIKELSNIFKENGKKLYIVGGWVRDYLMGKTPEDIDLTTDSLPDETLEFLGGKYSVDLVGKAFGVIILRIGDQDIEIASFREDSSGRKPDVKLGVTIEEDVKRRDLTISALFYDIDKEEIVDLVGGIDDINNRVIRMVGDPLDRINEDQLRVLRLIRFASRYNFDIDPKTAESVSKNVDLSGISKERIVEEFLKSYKKGSGFKRFLDTITKFDIWDQIFGDLKINREVEETDDLVLYLSNLLKFNDPKRLGILKDFYKWGSKETDSIKFLISLKDFEPNKIVEYYKEKIRIGISDSMVSKWTELSGFDNKDIIEKFIKYSPSVKSQDLINMGIKGIELGKEIKRLEIEKFKSML